MSGVCSFAGEGQRGERSLWSERNSLSLSAQSREAESEKAGNLDDYIPLLAGLSSRSQSSGVSNRQELTSCPSRKISLVFGYLGRYPRCESMWGHFVRAVRWINNVMFGNSCLGILLVLLLYQASGFWSGWMRIEACKKILGKWLFIHQTPRCWL